MNRSSLNKVKLIYFKYLSQATCLFRKAICLFGQATCLFRPLRTDLGRFGPTLAKTETELSSGLDRPRTEARSSVGPAQTSVDPILSGRPEVGPDRHISDLS